MSFSSCIVLHELLIHVFFILRFIFKSNKPNNYYEDYKF